MPSTELSDANAGGNGRGRGEVRAVDAMGLVSARSGPGDVAGPGRERHGSGLSRRQNAQPDAMDPGFHGVRTHSRTPLGRSESGISRRQNALDPGFHDVPVGWAHPDQEVDGASVAWVQFRERAAWVRALAPPGCGH